MLRITICHCDSEHNQRLFDNAMAALRTVPTKCELSRHRSTEKVLENLMADKRYYDIYILNSADPACMELAKKIRGDDLLASIIFTAPDTDGVKAMLKYRPSALVTDCTDGEALGELLCYCCNEQMRCVSYFTVKNKDSLMRISLDEISFFESRQRLAILHSRRHTVEFYAKLSEVMANLPPSEFVRCHQSYIVNLNKVTRLDKSNRCFVLSSGTVIEISKANYTQVVAQYLAFVEGK